MSKILGFLLFPSFILSLLILQMWSPLLLSLMIVGLSVLVTIQFVTLANYWAMFVIILAFTGGMMIVMMYVNSLSSPHRLMISKSKSFSVFLIVMFLACSTGDSLAHMLPSTLGPISQDLLVFALAGLFVIKFLFKKLESFINSHTQVHMLFRMLTGRKNFPNLFLKRNFIPSRRPENKPKKPFILFVWIFFCDCRTITYCLFFFLVHFAMMGIDSLEILQAFKEILFYIINHKYPAWAVLYWMKFGEVFLFETVFVWWVTMLFVLIELMLFLTLFMWVIEYFIDPSDYL